MPPSPISRTIGYARGTGSYNSEVSSAYDGGLRDPTRTRGNPAASDICTRKSTLAKSTSSEISGREYHRGTEHGTMEYTYRIYRISVSAMCFSIMLCGSHIVKLNHFDEYKV